MNSQSANAENDLAGQFAVRLAFLHSLLIDYQSESVPIALPAHESTCRPEGNAFYQMSHPSAQIPVEILIVDGRSQIPEPLLYVRGKTVFAIRPFLDLT